MSKNVFRNHYIKYYNLLDKTGLHLKKNLTELIKNKLQMLLEKEGSFDTSTK